jgi:hypothetical protein
MRRKPDRETSQIQPVPGSWHFKSGLRTPGSNLFLPRYARNYDLLVGLGGMINLECDNLQVKKQRGCEQRRAFGYTSTRK